jgi:predicted glycosyltransferase
VTEEEIKSQKQLAAAAKRERKQLAKAAKREQKQLAKAAKQERKQLAKAAKLSAKIQRILAKIEQKLITHADNPKAVDQLNRKKIELLVKRDKIQENLSIN